MSINKAIIVGNLGHDPELRRLPSGQAVADLRVATNFRSKDRDGNHQDRTEWHRVEVWGAMAESCERYLSKGRQIYVEGRLTTQKWTDRDGNDRYTTKIVANTVQFLDSPRTRDEAPSGSWSAPQSEAAVTPAAADMPF